LNEFINQSEIDFEGKLLPTFPEKRAASGVKKSSNEM
jgi:hypothetical protein